MSPWWDFLYYSLAFVFSARVARWLGPYYIRFRETPAAQLNQTFFEYWPCIQWALLIQALTIILGGILLDRYSLWFVLTSFGFWVVFFFFALPVLLVARSRPGRVVTIAVPVIPVLIFSALYWLDSHHAT
jgi:hypothetical protein